MTGSRALTEACLTVLRGRDAQPDEDAVYCPAMRELFRIPEVLLRTRILVAAMREPRRLEDFLPEVAPERRGQTAVVRSAVASTLLAAFELCRGAVVRLDQREPFGAITVSPAMARRDEDSAGR